MEGRNYGIKAQVEEELLERYMERAPYLVKFAGPELRRLIVIEEIELEKVLIRLMQRARSSIRRDAIYADGSLAVRVIVKRQLQNAVFQSIREKGRLTEALIQDCIGPSSHWDGRNFSEMIEHANDVHNRRSKELRSVLKKALRRVRKLEEDFGDPNAPVFESQERIKKALADAPVPKHLSKPPRILVEALWPILKDQQFAMRDAAVLLARSFNYPYPLATSQLNSQVESFRQAILGVEKLLR